ncbi:hypothetical protein AMTRI_Chr02g263410 [Amborella trichopoda]|uniref:F-box domain-containing protein n=1 Tax=Amborella trichopoda TaxID=13333 RepID=W1NZY9_AMBTC|nr:F-box protein At5g49610 [Amborella trichopoda]ERN03152.1 hypothetical protein AMTR_s00003p00108910 [Amborella trichopoda]|eukprot:XP_006841477.1 F-box protein At5g49610 [Amborella trichopoda]
MDSSDSWTGTFPDDVIMNILARLPVKSMFRFKCVCKAWHKLTSDPYFIKFHNEMPSASSGVLVEIVQSVSNQSNFVCIDSSSHMAEFSLDFLSDRVKIRASCNGLLCCASIPNRGVYYICNPATRQWRILPRTRTRPVTRYHPDDEANLVGLAFDPKFKKFNVVLAGFYRPFGRRALDCLVCQIFDSETNLWRRSIVTQNDVFTHMNRNQVVFARRSLHWLTYSTSHILVLNLDKEIWMRIPLPNVLVGAYNCRVYLLELEGAVSLVQITEGFMSIWVLDDCVGENWVELERVNLRCIKGFIPSIFPISQSRDLIFLATQRHIFVYHLKSMVWKEVYSVKNSVAYPLWFSSYAHRSTLYSW